MTERQLKRIINEEIENILNEDSLNITSNITLPAPYQPSSFSQVEVKKKLQWELNMLLYKKVNNMAVEYGSIDSNIKTLQSALVSGLEVMNNFAYIDTTLRDSNQRRIDEPELLIFKPSILIAIAKQINKVIKKYKKYETSADSIPAMTGYGNVRATRSGFIQGACNYSAKDSDFLIGVQVGGNISYDIKKRIFKEIFEILYIVSQYSRVYALETEGTNWSSIGLKCSKYSLSNAKNIESIMNAE
jgi:hypothetical protein